MSDIKTMNSPSLRAIEIALDTLRDRIIETPVLDWPADKCERHFSGPERVVLKLELLQHTGSFKPRGALTNALRLDSRQLQQGLTAVSAGNHAAAVAFAAGQLGTTAKVVMPETANPFRVALCRGLGAEVVFANDVHQAFELTREIQAREGRTFIHPFEGEGAALGSGGLGLEFYRQARHLDAVIVPIGGGGLCAGVACAIKQMNPRCRVIGVEPSGADSMHRSFQAGSPQAIERVHTIADSLGAPHAAEYSFNLCRRFVDELVMIDDRAMCQAMNWLMTDVKLAVEPAAAAASAALAGPLYGRLRGTVGVIVCGANIDPKSYRELLRLGSARG